MKIENLTVEDDRQAYRIFNSSISSTHYHKLIKLLLQKEVRIVRLDILTPAINNAAIRYTFKGRNMYKISDVVGRFCYLIMYLIRRTEMNLQEEIRLKKFQLSCYKSLVSTNLLNQEDQELSSADTPEQQVRQLDKKIRIFQDYLYKNPLPLV